MSSAILMVLVLPGACLARVPTGGPVVAVPVLAYHHVLPAEFLDPRAHPALAADSYIVSREQLRSQLEFLLKEDTSPSTPETLLLTWTEEASSLFGPC